MNEERKVKAAGVETVRWIRFLKPFRDLGEISGSLSSSTGKARTQLQRPGTSFQENRFSVKLPEEHRESPDLQQNGRQDEAYNTQRWRTLLHVLYLPFSELNGNQSRPKFHRGALKETLSSTGEEISK